ncbi:uncharacterized protein LOC131151328 [Malania oleifera]|uniref:uncharacterized protein LOC131151328 n=1 Tax=Malania oleifera TaxID=397392 RepID=UPI0025AE71C4|nr:uncharacterized protein LOC131151328 [Malania oleifera]
MLLKILCYVMVSRILFCFRFFRPAKAARVVPVYILLAFCIVLLPKTGEISCRTENHRSYSSQTKKENRGLKMASCPCCNPSIFVKSMNKTFLRSRTSLVEMRSFRTRPAVSRVSGARASMVDSYESSSNFAKRMEQAWVISQQPRPIACSSCNTSGHVECKWCGGTGFFILGNNMLCQVPSRNTNCVICGGKGSMCCSDCKGTGFRAKWLGEPPISN